MQDTRCAGGRHMAHAYVDYSDWNALPLHPVVSVVMATYNHERYLGEAIEGVVNQETDFPFELIVGEDCSSDRTRAVALRYQREYPAIIRVIAAQVRAGMHENCGRMVAAARGPYLAFCEGDDCWHRHDKLRDQIALMESDPNVSLVCTSWRTVSDDGTVLATDALGLENGCVHSLGLDDILIGRVKTVTVCTKTDLIRRALRESPLCRAGRYPFGDAPMWVEASRHGRCLCIPRDYGTYRLSRNSATRPEDIMDVYRFVAAASGFNRDVLVVYPLPQGERAAMNACIQATRKRLRALALLGEASMVREELSWLDRLAAKVRLRDYLLYAVALISPPGTWRAALRGWALRKWHASIVRYAVTPPAGQFGPLMDGVAMRRKCEEPLAPAPETDESQHLPWIGSSGS